jgi:hypothetical protein
VAAFVTAGAGFLLAVLWLDLMFDVQTLTARNREVPDGIRASIADYYARVTTAARPMNWLIAGAMVGTIAAIGVQLAQGDTALWVGLVSLGLAGAPVLLAAVRTVPNARRLGIRADPPSRQSQLARAICRDHFICLAGIGALLGLQLALGH